MRRTPPAARMPTLNDVAREAGVSKIAVSVVLNGARSQTRVSEATRARILETAARLHYEPNAAARSLSRGRTSAIGILFGALPVTTSPIREIYGASIIQGIADACADREYDLMLFTRRLTANGTVDLARLRSRRTDGVIVIAPDAPSQIVETLVGMGIRTVAVSYPAPPDETTLRWSSADVDNYRGARLAVEHLISLGHRRIAHLSGTPTVYSAVARRAGYIDALRDAGLSIAPEWLVEGFNMGTPGCKDGSFSGELAQADTRRLLSLPLPPTAIFAANDVMAVEVMRAAFAAGVRIPEELSVVGFDDRQIAALLTPSLTTVRQPMLQVGEASANLLIDQIERETRNGEDPDGPPAADNVTILLAPELIVRQSTAPPTSAPATTAVATTAVARPEGKDR